MRCRRFGTRLAAIVGVLLIGTVAVAGKVYRWVDADGQVHLSDRPPAAVTPEVDEVEPQPTLNGPSEAPATPARTRPPASDSPALVLPPGLAGHEPRACPTAVAARIHALDAAMRDRDHTAIPALYASFARIQLSNVLPDGSRRPAQTESPAQFAESLGESMHLLEGYQWVARQRLECQRVRELWVARGSTEEIIGTGRTQIRIVTQGVHHLSMASGLITKSKLEARWIKP